MLRWRIVLGVLFVAALVLLCWLDARAARLTGYSATVFKTCLFLLPPTFEQFLALPRDTFDDAEELLDAGWVVD